MTTTLSIDQFIEDQVRRWEASRRAAAKKPKREPIVTITSQSGCGGRTLGKTFAERLGLDFFDDEILRRVAESAHLSEAVLRSVDERARTLVEEWIQSLFTERYLRGDYLHHLSRTVAAIAAHGSAVVVGHGAAFVVPPESSLRVLLVAPLEARIRYSSAAAGLTHAVARRRIEAAEAERRGFVRESFNADFLDPARYDLCLDTSAFGHEGALRVLEAAFRERRERMPEA